MTTTLHSAMTLAVICMEKGLHLEIQFHTDRSTLPKALKGASSEMIWLDYGVSIDRSILERLLFPTEEKYKILVVPCVLEGIDWKKFKDLTIQGSDQPAHQRGLTFDTTCMSSRTNIGEFISSVHDGRVICFRDPKWITKKCGGYKSLDHLKTALDVKIGVLKSAYVTCHYVYECFGNIVESSGVRVAP